MLILFVASINMSPLVARKQFLDREGSEPENIKYNKISKHLHQPKMFNGSRVFAHFLVIESNWGSAGGAPSGWRIGDLVAK